MIRNELFEQQLHDELLPGVRLLAWIFIIGFTSCVPLDYLLYPARVWDMLLVRVVVVGMACLVVGLSFSPWNQNRILLRSLSYCNVLNAGFGLTCLVYTAGGSICPYWSMIPVVFFASAILHRFSILEAIVIYSSVNVFYCGLLLWSGEPIFTVSFASSNVGLFIGMAIAVVAAGYLRTLQRKEFNIRTENQKIMEEFKRGDWIKTHLAKIASDMHQARNLTELGQGLLSSIAPLLTIGHAVFYIIDETDNLLHLIASYGFSDYKKLKQNIKIGEGLTGQCIIQKARITLANPPQDYVCIKSALGDSMPKCIVVQPIIHIDNVLGVLEIASLQSFDDRALALLEHLMPMLAMSLEILKRNVSTEHLLEETKEQAKRMEMQAAQLEEQSVEMASQKNELIQTEAWFRGIVESATDGMIVVDEQGRIILCNLKSEEIFGYESGELIGQNIDHLLPLDVRADHAAKREQFMSEHRSRPMNSDLDLKGMRKDGIEFPIEVGLSRLPDVGGRGLCVCASVRDITERKQAGEHR